MNFGDELWNHLCSKGHLENKPKFIKRDGESVVSQVTLKTTEAVSEAVADWSNVMENKQSRAM